MEEQSRLEKKLEEVERKGEQVELRLEDELCSVRSRLAAKEEVGRLLKAFSHIVRHRNLLRLETSWRRQRADG